MLLFKRFFDLLFSVLISLVIWPVFIVIAIIIKLESNGPILFRQLRIGENKEQFYILKFRTMKIDTPNDMPTHLLKDPASYITKSGSFLRKSSLDELPQLINVIKGDMSFIGPRPALWNQYDLIEERDKYRVNDVKPGITGLAQVMGRDELPIPIKSKYDGHYASKVTLKADLKIVIRTIKSVLKSEGVVEGHIENK